MKNSLCSLIFEGSESRRALKWSALIATVAGIIIGSFGMNAKSYAASFDCRQAVIPAERLVCGDSQLSDLDDQLAEAYRQSIATLGTHQIPELREQQRAWLVARRMCSNKECIVGLYRSRIVELQDFSRRTSQRSIPQFRDYPVDKIHNGRNSPVQLVTNLDKTYRTRLRDASYQKPNFAGHYMLASWGCGTECVTGAAIDLLTGKVIWLPATICCAQNTDAKFEPIVFRLDSRLIVLSGRRNEKEGDDAAHFYRIEGDEFVFITDIPRVAEQPTTSETPTQIGSPAISAANVPEPQRSQPTDRGSVDGKIIQTVLAEGLGSTIESAIHNAAENALKQVVGTFIDTETLIVRRTQISDGIKNEARSINARTREYSQGSIYRFDVIETKQEGGLFRISAKVSVRVEDFKVYMAKPSESSARIGAEVFAQRSTQTENASNARQILIEKIIIPIIKGEFSAISINNPIIYSEFIKRHPDRALRNYVPSTLNIIAFDAMAELNPNFSENIRKTLESIAVHKERIPPALAQNPGAGPNSFRGFLSKIQQKGKFDYERDTLIFLDPGNHQDIGPWGSGGLWDAYVIRDVKIRTNGVRPLASASNLADAIAQCLDGAAAQFIFESRNSRFAELGVSIKSATGKIKNEFIVPSGEQYYGLQDWSPRMQQISGNRLHVNSGWSNISASGRLGENPTYFIISSKRKFNIFLDLNSVDVGANDTITVKLIPN